MTWIQQFEPQNINSHDLLMPEDLKQMTEMSKNLIMKKSNSRNLNDL